VYVRAERLDLGDVTELDHTAGRTADVAVILSYVPTVDNKPRS